ncbi:MAG TPA: hypothetical protein VLR91_05405 [Thermodesulfobacteriota bacterium]|nr:hypothetical protein [Thermodesulfobacteriota bacterium]
MMHGIKKQTLLPVLLLVLSLLVIPLSANAETIKGKLEGITCLLKGYICPIDKADPMINLEKDFVVVTADGKYYYLSNIGLGLKGKYALEVVEATGKLNAKYMSMDVDTLTVKGKTVFSKKAQEEMMRTLQP